MEYDKHTQLAERRFVPPAFNDIRHILNIAQIMAVASRLKLIVSLIIQHETSLTHETFDGDQTLYADGMDFANDDTLVDHIVHLLQNGIYFVLYDYTKPN